MTRLVTTTGPATMLGLGESVGSLRAGLSADLLVLDDQLGVQRVMRRGAWVAEERAPAAV